MSNPISQAYIHRTIKSKENAKNTNKLIRNEDMSKNGSITSRKEIKRKFITHHRYQLEVITEN